MSDPFPVFVILGVFFAVFLWVLAGSAWQKWRAHVVSQRDLPRELLAYYSNSRLWLPGAITLALLLMYVPAASLAAHEPENVASLSVFCGVCTLLVAVFLVFWFRWFLRHASWGRVAAPYVALEREGIKLLGVYDLPWSSVEAVEERLVRLGRGHDSYLVLHLTPAEQKRIVASPYRELLAWNAVAKLLARVMGVELGSFAFVRSDGLQPPSYILALQAQRFLARAEKMQLA